MFIELIHFTIFLMYFQENNEWITLKYIKTETYKLHIKVLNVNKKKALKYERL